jgi:hypothetical protein
MVFVAGNIFFSWVVSSFSFFASLRQAQDMLSGSIVFWGLHDQWIPRSSRGMTKRAARETPSSSGVFGLLLEHGTPCPLRQVQKAFSVQPFLIDEFATVSSQTSNSRSWE